MPAIDFLKNGREWTCTTVFGFSNRRLLYLSYPARNFLSTLVAGAGVEPAALGYESGGEDPSHPALEFLSGEKFGRGVRTHVSSALHEPSGSRMLPGRSHAPLVKWRWWQESNLQPVAYEANALNPVELHHHEILSLENLAVALGFEPRPF